MTNQKLCICIIHNRDKNRVSEELLKAGFKFTVIGSSGGFLREGNTTLLIGCSIDEVPVLKTTLSAFCSSRNQLVNVPIAESGAQSGMIPNPVNVKVGGAVLFMMGVEEFARY